MLRTKGTLEFTLWTRKAQSAKAGVGEISTISSMLLTLNSIGETVVGADDYALTKKTVATEREEAQATEFATGKSEPLTHW